MIRLRQDDGTAQVVPPQFPFVELVNEVDGTVQQVICQPRPGVLFRIPPGSPEAEAYANLFRAQGVRFTPREASVSLPP